MRLVLNDVSCFADHCSDVLHMFDFQGDLDEKPHHRRFNGAEHFDLVCSDNGGGSKKGRVELIKREGFRHMLELRSGWHTIRALLQGVKSQ